MFSLHLDFKKNKSELCEIGAKYDTDKSSQRKNVTNYNHCHPYTLLYDSIFKDYKNEKLNIAELGILKGASLLMWREYFCNSTIYGYDNNEDFINNFKKNHDCDKIILDKMEIYMRESIHESFQKSGVLYDIIVEDTTHQFEDQIRFIECCHSYLKPGGILIIENIFKAYNENDYIDRLKPLLCEFETYGFITLDHANRCSYGWDNDKLFILIKKGEPIFKNKNKITVITPSYRTTNLHTLKNSIDFKYIDEWIIVYDGSKITENPLLFANQENGKIKEHIFKGKGISGNPQRNYALDLIKDKRTYLYFLDDDNIIHPHFYKLIPFIKDNQIYTFDQINHYFPNSLLHGNNVNVGRIDTAMFLIDYNLCNDNRWILEKYDADGYYIIDCFQSNQYKWIYVNNTLSYYNYIQKK